MRDLEKCLQSSKVDEKVFTYFRDVLQFESASDFVGYFTSKTYEQGIVEEVLRHIPALATNRVQAGRLRLYWETARAEVTEKTALGARQGTSPAVDMETPLDPDDHKHQVEEFEKIYRFAFDAEVTVCATQFARNLREFKKRAKTVEQLEKVKSEAQFFSVCATTKKSEFAAGWTLSKETIDIPDRDLSTIPKILLAHKIMVNGWAMTGTMLVDSKLKPGTKVRDAGYTQCIAYHDVVHLQSIVHPGPASTTACWIVERDRVTRTKARSLYKQGWPWGEALEETRNTTCAVLWTIGAIGVQDSAVAVTTTRGEVPSFQQPANAAPVAKRVVHSEHRQNCPRWNTKEGCAAKGSDCPLGQPHRCSFSNGTDPACNAWQHKAIHCPANPNRLDKHDSKGGQKRGKGGQGSGSNKRREASRFRRGDARRENEQRRR